MAIVSNEDNQIIWAHLLKKNLRKVLLGDGPALRYSYGRFIIQKRGARFGLFCVLLTVWLSVIVSFCVLFSYEAFYYTVPNLLILGTVIIVATLGVLSFHNICKISWNNQEHVLCIHCGTYLFPRMVSISKDKLQVEIYKDNLSGKTLLALRHVNFITDKVLNVAKSSFKTDLMPIFEKISTFLENKSIDRAAIQATLSGGETIKVCTTPISTVREPSSKGMSLRFPSPDKAVLQPSSSQYLFWLSVLAVGVWLLYELYFKVHQDRPFWHDFFIVFTIGSFLTLGVAGLLFGFRIRKITADKISHSMSIKQGILGLRTAKYEYLFDEIVGFQICYRKITGDDLYEFNVVLNDPKTRRINIATSIDKQDVQKNAQGFAQFIGKPLFDHSKGI